MWSILTPRSAGMTRFELATPRPQTCVPSGAGLHPEKILKIKKKFSNKSKVFNSRDDKIRTCDPTPPRRVRYRAALHPEKLYTDVIPQ